MRRANVAFTRARRGVIVIGNPATLARDEGTWLPWLHWTVDLEKEVLSGTLSAYPKPKRRFARTGGSGPQGSNI